MATWLLFGKEQARVVVSQYAWVDAAGRLLGKVARYEGRWYAECRFNDCPYRHPVTGMHPVGIGTPARRRRDAVRDLVRHAAAVSGEPWREVA